jgi:hypothetical protein
MEMFLGGSKVEVLEKTLEMRGMQRREIISYFININEKNISNGKFIYEGWEVYISEEVIIELGALRIPSTTVIFRGEKESIYKIILEFRLKFLTAGG